MNNTSSPHQNSVTYCFARPYLSGGGRFLSVLMSITNVDSAGDGQSALPTARGETVDILLAARPETGDDVEITRVEGVRVNVLRVGRTIRTRARVQSPATVTDGPHRIVATLDPDNKVAELNEPDDPATPQENNVALTDPFEVVQGLPDLVVVVPETRSIPEETISSNGKYYNLPFEIWNVGTLAVEKEKTVDVTVIQQSADGSDEFLLETIEGIKIGGLRSGRKIRGRTRVEFINRVNDLPFSELDIQNFKLTVDPTMQITELDEENNDGVSQDIDVLLGAPEVSFDIRNQVRVPTKPIISGTGKKFTAPIEVHNHGNVPFDFFRFTPYNLTLVARPDGAIDDSEDGAMSEETLLTVRRVNVDRSNSFRVTGTLPEQMPDGTYNLVTKVRFMNVLDQESIEYYENSDRSFDVIGGFKNLTVNFADGYTAPDETLAGSGRVTRFPVVVTNTGNLPLPKDATARLEILARPAGLGDDPSADVVVYTDNELKLARLGPERSKKLNLPVRLPAGLAEPDPGEIPPLAVGDGADFVFVAKITPSDDVNESDDTDNEALSDPIHVIEGNPDLAVEIADAIKAPTDVVTGNGKTYRIPLIVSNLGNLATDNKATVSIKILARPTGEGDDVVVTELSEVRLGRIAPGRSRNLNVLAEFPSDLLDGTYELIVKIDSSDEIAELDEENNESAPKGAFDAVRGLPDLALEITDDRLDDRELVSGNGATLNLTVNVHNAGNLRTKVGQAVDFKIKAVSEDEETMFDVATVESVDVGSIRTGRSRKANLQFTLPREVTTGTYRLVVEADAANGVTEHGDGAEDENVTEAGNGLNNVAEGPVIHVTRGAPDLTIAFSDRLDLPDQTVSGDGSKLKAPLVITNEGNLTVVAKKAVKIVIFAHLVDDGDDHENDIEVAVLEEYVVGGLRPGQSRRVTAQFVLPPGFGPGTFSFIAKVDTIEQIEELDETNNEATSV